METVTTTGYDDCHDDNRNGRYKEFATAVAKTVATAVAMTVATAVAKTVATAVAMTVATAVAMTVATAVAMTVATSARPYARSSLFGVYPCVQTCL